MTERSGDASEIRSGLAQVSRLSRPRLSRVAAEEVLGYIARNGLRPGDRLPTEQELMETLGVGRSSVREALNGLAVMGAIEVRHGQGAFVLDGGQAVSSRASDTLSASLGKGVSADLLEAREAVETTTARLAARRATAEALRELREDIAAHSLALENADPAARPSAKFHVLVAQASHNEVLAEVLRGISVALEERGPELERLPGYREWELREHGSILDAIERRDEGLAVARMRDHLVAMADNFRRTR